MLVFVIGRVFFICYCVAEVRSRSGVEVRSLSGASAWPRSAWPRLGRALWCLLGRGHVFVRGFSQLLLCCARCLRSAVALQVRGWVVVLAFVLGGACFSSVHRRSFLFQLTTAEVAFLAVGRLAHLCFISVSLVSRLACPLI